MPEIRLGEPGLKNSFNMQEVDGVTVYMDKGMFPLSDVHIILRKFLGFKVIDVTGFNLS
jgi:hypothetical protein